MSHKYVIEILIYKEKVFKFVCPFTFGSLCIFAIRDVGLLAEASPSTSSRLASLRFGLCHANMNNQFLNILNTYI